MTEAIDRDRARLLGLATGEPTRRLVATVPLGRAARLEEVAELVASWPPTGPPTSPARP